MYYLLVEAAGIRQASRIHREWYDRFLLEVRNALGDHGFELAKSDNDLLLFREAIAATMEPEAITEATRCAVERLRHYVDDIIDFVVLVDYQVSAPIDEVLLRMEALLRYVREHGTAYCTDHVISALEPLVETVESGSLHRIVAYHGNGRLEGSSYHRSVPDETITAAVEKVFPIDGRRFVWITSADVDTVGESVKHLAGDSGYTIFCDSTSTVLGVLTLLARRVTGDFGPRNAAGGRNDRLSRAFNVLQRRFSSPEGAATPSAWLEGELRCTVQTGLNASGEGEDLAVIILVGLHELTPATQVDLLRALIPDRPNTRRYRLIVVSKHQPEAPHLLAATWWYHLSVPEIGDRVFEFWASLSKSVSPGDSPSFETVVAALRQAVSLKHRAALRVIASIAPILPSHLVDDLYPQLGISLAERGRIIKDLVQIGLVRDRGPLIVHRRIAPAVDALFSEAERREVDAAIFEFLIGRIERREVTVNPGVWRIIAHRLDGEQKNLFRHELLHRIATGGAFETYEEYAVPESITGVSMKLSDAAARMKLYLRDSKGPEDCDPLYQIVHRHLSSKGVSPIIEADVHLGLGEYLLARRDYPNALSAAKRAIMLQQDGEVDPIVGSGTGMSHLLMARIMFAQRRLSEAGRYLGFAHEETVRAGATRLVAHSLEAIRLFLVGNVSRARKRASELYDPLLSEGFTDWLLLLWFLLGRVEYELGEYSAAEEYFIATSEYCRASGIAAPLATLEAWSIRSRYANDGTPDQVATALEAVPETAETLFFVAEALTRHGQFEEAIPLLQRSIEREADSDRWPRLGVCWDNGYASIEDLVISDRKGSTELSRIARAYYAWSLAHVDRHDEAVSIFYDLTRGNGASSIDPYTGFYNFLYSSILPEKRSRDRDDRITILGKSVKLIQERTSKIDDYRDKNRYLKYNRWNFQLMTEARHHNLV